MYRRDKSYKVRFVFKKDYTQNKFFCEIFVGQHSLFTSKRYRNKRELKFYCKDMIVDLWQSGHSFTDVSNQQVGGKMSFSPSKQEKLYKQFKEEHGLE